MSGDYSGRNHRLEWDASNLATRGIDILLPGSVSHYIKVDDSDDWAFQGDFCVELFRAQFNNGRARHSMISHYNASGNQRSWGLDYWGDQATPHMRAQLSSNGSDFTIITGEVTLSDNTPYDICMERSGSTVRIYVDGVMVGKGTFAGALNNSTQPLEIGRGLSKTGSAWAGSFTACRITLAARYASDAGYTPPSLPLPTSEPAP